MNMFAKMNIAQRLSAGFALVLGLTVVIAAAAIWRMHAIADATHAMMAVPLAKECLIADWHTQTFGAIRRTAAVVKRADPSLVGFFKDDSIKTAARGKELIKRIEPLLEGDDERAVFKAIIDVRDAYTAAKEKAVKARADGNTDGAARILDGEFMPPH